jgi:hypothetical protein
VHTRLLERRAREGFHDLTDVFDHDASLVYLDWSHVTPEANDTLARVMVTQVTSGSSGLPASRRSP